ncbi:MAG: alpha/beta hydrolase-fold protein, partial [Myxococcota bacterium]|nr:alpha/beta hydrolase-fold protein [Myxococcota bacterium]
MRSLLELARRLEEAPHQLDEELARFVRTHEFPLVDGDTATFFYVSDDEVDEVYLVHWVFGLESRQRFLRLGQTDAWYLPLELPHGGRVEYKIECIVDGRRVLVRDPLNERRAYDPFGSNSVCPMPGYTEPAWSDEDPGVAAGRVESFEVDAASFGDTRAVSVYLPAEFKAYKAYPLLICHDGRDYLRFAGLKGVLDNLIARHEVAPLIVALVDGGDRNREFGANPAHARFIAEDLLPTLESQ